MKKKKMLLKNKCGQKWCQSQFTKYKLQLTITRSCRSFDDSRLVVSIHETLDNFGFDLIFSS